MPLKNFCYFWLNQPSRGWRTQIWPKTGTGSSFRRYFVEKNEFLGFSRNFRCPLLRAWEVDIWVRKLLHGVEHVEDCENLKKNRNSTIREKCAQSWKTHFRLNIFALSEALTMALMVTAPGGGSSVTVRDRPNKVLGVE